MQLSLTLAFPLLFEQKVGASTFNSLQETFFENINENKWERKINNLNVVKMRQESTYSNISTSFKELEKENQEVVEGKVTNLEEMVGEKNTATTKVTLHVIKEISGNKDLEDKDIQFIMTGGPVKVKDLLAGMEEKAEKNGFPYKELKNKKVYVENTSAPLPEIGSDMVMGLNENNYYSGDSDYNNYLKINGLGGQSSYSTSAPDFNMWIKHKSAKEYTNVNSEFSNLKDYTNVKSKSLNGMYGVNGYEENKDYQAIKDIATEINNKLN